MTASPSPDATSDDTSSERQRRFNARVEAGRRRRSHGDDLRAAARLTVDATKGVMDTVAGMQAATSPPLVSHIQALANAITRGTTGLVGATIDGVLGVLAPMLGESVPGEEREAVLAALNGVVGDRLAASESPLAITTSLWPALDDEDRRGTLLLLVHGSSMNPQQWRMPRKPEGAEGGQPVFHDHGRALLDVIERDTTLAYAHYNSGQHICDSGRQLAELIEREHRTAEGEGFDEIVLLCHSMGGLVARSAIATAEREGHRWRRLASTLITLGTPHHGSHLERAGHVVDVLLDGTRWTAPLAPLGKIRSAGVTDLRHGAVIDKDPDRFASGSRLPTHVPLPEGVRTLAVAGTRSAAPDAADDPADDGAAPTGDGLADDNLVPVKSGLGLHEDPARTLTFGERRVVYETHHLKLLSSAEVFDILQRSLRRS